MCKLFLVFIMIIACSCQSVDDIHMDENTAESCQDGFDNDDDGFFDCEDQDCSAIVFCSENDTMTISSDGDADSDSGGDTDSSSDGDTDNTFDSDTVSDIDPCENVECNDPYIPVPICSNGDLYASEPIGTCIVIPVSFAAVCEYPFVMVEECIGSCEYDYEEGVHFCDNPDTDTDTLTDTETGTD